jgi:hypothetical protein
MLVLENKHQTLILDYDIINFSVFFQQGVVPHFQQWMKLEIRLLSGFVKTFQPVLESNWHCCREKSVCLFLGALRFFTSFTNPCQAFDLLHQVPSMQMV